MLIKLIYHGIDKHHRLSRYFLFLILGRDITQILKANIGKCLTSDPRHKQYLSLSKIPKQALKLLRANHATPAAPPARVLRLGKTTITLQRTAAATTAAAATAAAAAFYFAKSL